MKTSVLVPFLAASFLLPAADRVTFSETIAPILYENCVSCHRPGEAAPFALISFEDVRKRGALIATVTKSRFMPPWHAEHGYGEFVDERRLTDAQIALIGEWVKQGMPQGDPVKMPKLPAFTGGWHLGKPDLVLEMPAGFEVPASGPDIYRNFAIPTGLTEDKWVRAVEFRPAARKAVHHAIFAFVRSGAMKDFEGKDGKTGFGGMNGLGLGVGVQPNFAPSGGLGGWAVGGTPAFLPEGQALPLNKGTDFILQMHFHPTGKPETERAVVGLYFAEKAPEKALMDLNVPSLFAFGSGLDIPAGSKTYAIRDSATIDADVRVLSVAAHAHYLGKEMKAIATLPDGTTKPLLWIKDWDFNWQEQYTYKQPVLLPKGTRVDVAISYDNSADNPRNPNNPPKRVQWGEQSFDEMGGVMLSMVAARKEDEASFGKTGAARMQAAIGQGVQNGTVRRYMDQQTRARALPQRIGVYDRQGKVVATLGEPALYSQPALSPDGSHVAAIRSDRETGASAVWVFDIATGAGAAITPGNQILSAPAWSPDGRQVAYVMLSDTDSTSSIYRRAADGSGKEEFLYKSGPNASPVITDWSAGGLLCFWVGNGVTYILPVDGDRKATELKLAKSSSRGARISPDGRWIAYSSNEGGGMFGFQTWVEPYPPSPGVKPVQASKDPALGGIFWRTDGKELLFLGLPGGAITSAEVDTSSEFKAAAPKVLFRVPGGVSNPGQLSSVASADAQRFVFLTPAPAVTSSR